MLATLVPVNFVVFPLLLFGTLCSISLFPAICCFGWFSSFIYSDGYIGDLLALFLWLHIWYVFNYYLINWISCHSLVGICSAVSSNSNLFFILVAYVEGILVMPNFCFLMLHNLSLILATNNSWSEPQLASVYFLTRRTEVVHHGCTGHLCLHSSFMLAIEDCTTCIFCSTNEGEGHSVLWTESFIAFLQIEKTPV